MCAFSHMVLPIPVIMTPAFIMNMLTKFGKMPTNLFTKGALNIGASAIGLTVGLPFTMACFPQEVPITRLELEPHFHNLLDEKGERIEKFTFNRGT